MEKPKTRRKARRYLPALLWHVQKLRGNRGVVISIKTRDICGADKRCALTLRYIMMWLVEKGLARRHKQGVYLIERAAVEEVLSALREWI
jgi:predicted transcriptional regulator of viral defense system